MVKLGDEIPSVRNPVKVFEGLPGVFLHYCPGCDGYHYFHTTYKNRSNTSWTFNGNLENPTFHPSMNITGHCHYWLRNGRIEFLHDCAHDLKGQTVDLPTFDSNDPELQQWIDLLLQRTI